VFAASVLNVAEDGLTFAAGAAESAAGVLTAVEDGLIVAADAASTAGVPTVEMGAATPTAGAMTVSKDGMTVTTGAAAATAQCSEIMVTSVTAKPSPVPELAAPLTLNPISFTFWPRCGLRSTLLVAILKI
jgi:hypothetical protein